MGEAGFEEEVAAFSVEPLDIEIWAVGWGGKQCDDMFLASEGLEIPEERGMATALDQKGVKVRCILLDGLAEVSDVVDEFCREGE